MLPSLSALEQLKPLYRGTFLFGIACGISIALTPLYLDAHGFQKEEIGTLALLFAAGLVLFAVPVGMVIRRFGGKVTLTSTLIGYALAVSAFPFMETYQTIAGVRFLDGMFSIGVWVSSETILLSRADAKQKGHLTSLYAVWLASGYVVGPLLATGLARFASHRQLFLLAGGLALTSATYLFFALRNQGNERSTVTTERTVAVAAQEHDLVKEQVKEAEASALSVLGRIKTSCFAAFSYGYFQASVVLFLPLYLIESKNIPRNDTIILPGLFCLGMLLFSNWAGRVGDRVGHLRVVTVLSALGTLCVLGFIYIDAYVLMCALVLAAGATFASMSPVALALTGVVVKKSELSRANSFYNTFYAGGMLVGPPVSSIIFARHGGPMMLYHLVALWTVFVLFTLVFYQDDPASGVGADPADQASRA